MWCGGCFTTAAAMTLVVVSVFWPFLAIAAATNAKFGELYCLEDVRG
jgi:hypothetical protein